MSNVTVKGLLEAIRDNPGARVCDLISTADLAALAKERRDMERTMKRAASRITRLEQELDMLHDLFQDLFQQAKETKTESRAPTQIEARGENVVPITKHPKFRTGQAPSHPERPEVS